MHRFIVGTCTMTVRLVPAGTWIVRGHAKHEPVSDSRGQHHPRDVLLPQLDRQGRPLLPASSFKGVLRSTAERILRTMQPDRNPQLIPLADDPFVHEQVVLADENASPERPSAALPPERGNIADSELREWLEQQPATWFESRPHYHRLMEFKPEPRFHPERAARYLYPVLSPASQLFGCTLHAGLLVLDDARAETQSLPRRSHVAIDRFTQGVGAGPFLEALAPAQLPLVTTLTITNFALWQIALLGLVFQELNRGYAAIGGGTRKGQGQIRILVPQIVVRYPELAYRVASGIVSAQVQLAREPWRYASGTLPEAMLAVEAEQTLLSDLEPQCTTDWREDGMRTLLVQEDNVGRLFREAVQQVWRPWVQTIIREAT